MNRSHCIHQLSNKKKALTAKKNVCSSTNRTKKLETGKKTWSLTHVWLPLALSSVRKSRVWLESLSPGWRRLVTESVRKCFCFSLLEFQISRRTFLWSGVMCNRCFFKNDDFSGQTCRGEGESLFQGLLSVRQEVQRQEWSLCSQEQQQQWNKPSFLIKLECSFSECAPSVFGEWLWYRGWKTDNAKSP